MSFDIDEANEGTRSVRHPGEFPRIRHFRRSVAAKGYFRSN